MKNSVLKVIDTETSSDIVKSEVCFFKNIFNTDDEGIPRSIKARKRLRLEYAIRSKMQMLKSDWRHFLETNYPELFVNDLKEDRKVDLSKNLK